MTQSHDRKRFFFTILNYDVTKSLFVKFCNMCKKKTTNNNFIKNESSRDD